VDDDPELGALTRAALRQLGYDSLLVRDAAAGIEQLEAQTWDLLLTDVHMPRIDGLGFLRRAQERGLLRSVPVVALSGVYPDESAMVEALYRAGAGAFVVRPFLPSTLDDAILAAAQARGDSAHRVPAATLRTDPGGLADRHSVEEANRAAIDDGPTIPAQVQDDGGGQRCLILRAGGSEVVIRTLYRPLPVGAAARMTVGLGGDALPGNAPARLIGEVIEVSDANGGWLARLRLRVQSPPDATHRIEKARLDVTG
jgi:two-component system chemotaxis response regulator CheY